MSKIGYDHRAVLVDGKRTLVLSGSIHYPRSTPSMWPSLMKLSREAGLNTIETYVFWNLHERERGVFDFSGRLDIRRFCALAAENGLNVILRIGPYICAETNYGGFPPWLRDVPGMRMRTWNKPFMREMERWTRQLCEYLRPMFAPAGGPIILAQIENEYGNVAKSYGKDGQRYLKWCVKVGDSLKLGVPLIMCVGGAKGALETINGHYGHPGLKNHFMRHPDQPALWTEFWPAWYDTFGYPNHKRTPQDMGYALARFFAGGGAGMNYYMWHGGTNFGREAMYLQTTSYSFDAPLDDFGLVTTKYYHMSRLHHILADYADVLLGKDPPAPRQLGGKQTAWSYAGRKRRLVFLCNDDEHNAATVSFENKSYRLAPFSVILLDDKVLMDTASLDGTRKVLRSISPAGRALSRFAVHSEPMPVQRLPAIIVREPVEQLQFTKDESDYCWYSASLNIGVKEAGEGILKLTAVADMVHVFVDNRLVATTRTPLAEDRVLFPKKTGEPLPENRTFVQTFNIKIPAGKHDLSILCCALGLIKGDWMLGMQNMALERKGLWGPVLWNGHPIRGPWMLRPGLVGEKSRLFDCAGQLAKWHPATAKSRRTPLQWWKATFGKPTGKSPVVIDMGSMTKGILWLNGKCVGRYWDAPANGPNLLEGWPLYVTSSDEPTQRYYHLSFEWLQKENTIVLFEEVGGDPSGIRICRWK